MTELDRYKLDQKRISIDAIIGNSHTKNKQPLQGGKLNGNTHVVLKGGHFSVILYSIGRMRVIDFGQGSDGLETSSKWFLGNFSRGAPGFELKNIDLGPKNIKKLHEKCHYNAIRNR